MDLIERLWDLFVHLDTHLNEWVGAVGTWIYAILFAIVFCETGLVVTPFLPGDSLLFAVGALAASEGSPLDLGVTFLVLASAAVLGDAVNYAIGFRLGPRVFTRRDSWLLNQTHLERTRRFYERHGGKTIVLARFIPIVRTFAPFVAGIGRMSYRRFAVFNVSGAIVWVALFLLGGYWFGNLPAIRNNFRYVILGIVVISVIPLVVELVRARSRKKAEPATDARA